MSKDKEAERSETYVLKTAKVMAKRKGGHTMELAYDKIITIGKEVHVVPVQEQPTMEPHMTMFKALQLMVPHLMIETEFAQSGEFKEKGYFEDQKALEDPKLKQFKVTGVHIKDIKEQRSVVLVGRKVLGSGKVINLSPLINIDNLDDGYVYAKELKKAVDDFLAEVEAYIEGKYGENPQLDIEKEIQKEKGKLSKVA